MQDFSEIFLKIEKEGKKGGKLDWLMLILRIIFGVILLVIIGGTGLFGYIAWKARARAWSGGMFGITAVSIFLLYWVILGNPYGILPL